MSALATRSWAICSCGWGIRPRRWEYFEKDLAVAEELVKLDPANTEFRRDVSMSYSSWAICR